MCIPHPCLENTYSDNFLCPVWVTDGAKYLFSLDSILIRQLLQRKSADLEKHKKIIISKFDIFFLHKPFSGFYKENCGQNEEIHLDLEKFKQTWFMYDLKSMWGEVKNSRTIVQPLLREK